MALLTSQFLTLRDVAKMKNVKGANDVAEVLAKRNPMLNDIPYKEMNQGTYHEESIRSNLPDIYYRKANQAIPASKSLIEQRKFEAAHFESKSQADIAVLKKGGKEMINKNRFVQAKGHIQAMAQEHASLTVYGSLEDSPQKSPGFFDIFSSLSGDTGEQVIDAGGSGSDNCSMLLVHWGEDSIFGVYPKGTTAGLSRTDHGKVQIHGLTAAGAAGTYWGLEEQFEIDHGLVVKDYRQAARIANIDVSELVAGTGADLVDLAISANYKIDSQENGQGIWYVNRTVQAILHKQARRDVGGGGGLSFDNYQGQKVLTLLGKPVRISDALLNTEDAVA